MSSFKSPNPTRRALILGALALGGCGFSPVYGTHGNGGVLRNTLDVETPATREGFRLRARVEDRLGRAADPQYRLQVTLRIEATPIAITTQQDTTRYNLPGVANWTLTGAGDDTVLASGEVDTFTAYSAAGTTVATTEAEGDARDRLAVGLADLIITRLMIAAQGL